MCGGFSPQMFSGVLLSWMLFHVGEITQGSYNFIYSRSPLSEPVYIVLFMVCCFY